MLAAAGASQRHDGPTNSKPTETKMTSTYLTDFNAELRESVCAKWRVVPMQNPNEPIFKSDQGTQPGGPSHRDPLKISWFVSNFETCHAGDGSCGNCRNRERDKWPHSR